MMKFEYGAWKVVDRIIPVLEPLAAGWELPDPVFVNIETERQILAVWQGSYWPTEVDLTKIQYECIKRLNCQQDEIFIRATWPTTGATFRGMNIL